MLKTLNKRYMAVLILTCAVLLGTTPVFSADPFGTMNKDELKDQLGSGRLIILDARANRDWNSSEFKIQGAQRAASGDFEQWSTIYAKDSTLVIYCA